MHSQSLFSPQRSTKIIIKGCYRIVLWCSNPIVSKNPPSTAAPLSLYMSPTFGPRQRPPGRVFCHSKVHVSFQIDHLGRVENTSQIRPHVYNLLRFWMVLVFLHIWDLHSSHLFFLPSEAGKTTRLRWGHWDVCRPKMGCTFEDKLTKTWRILKLQFLTARVWRCFLQQACWKRADHNLSSGCPRPRWQDPVPHPLSHTHIQSWRVAAGKFKVSSTPAQCWGESRESIGQI